MLGCQGPKPTVHAQAPPSASARRCGKARHPYRRDRPGQDGHANDRIEAEARQHEHDQREAGRDDAGPRRDCRESRLDGRARHDHRQHQAQEPRRREGGGFVGESGELRHAPSIKLVHAVAQRTLYLGADVLGLEPPDRVERNGEHQHRLEGRVEGELSGKPDQEQRRHLAGDQASGPPAPRLARSRDGAQPFGRRQDVEPPAQRREAGVASSAAGATSVQVTPTIARTRFSAMPSGDHSGIAEKPRSAASVIRRSRQATILRSPPAASSAFACRIISSSSTRPPMFNRTPDRLPPITCASSAATAAGRRGGGPPTPPQGDRDAAARKRLKHGEECRQQDRPARRREQDAGPSARHTTTTASAALTAEQQTADETPAAPRQSARYASRKRDRGRRRPTRSGRRCRSACRRSRRTGRRSTPARRAPGPAADERRRRRSTVTSFREVACDHGRHSGRRPGLTRVTPAVPTISAPESGRSHDRA